MGILKGLGTAILSFLLFLSLTVFGIAFLLHGTVLNPDFIAGQVDGIDVSAVAREITDEQIGGQLPADMPFLKDAIYNVIDENEPLLKEQVNSAIYDGYDFLLGRSDRLEIVISLEALKAGLKDSLWEAFRAELPRLLPDLVTGELQPYLDEHIHEFAGQIPAEYLPAGMAGLPEAQLRLYLEQYLRDVAGQITSRPVTPEVSGLLEVLVRPYFDSYYDEFIGQVPSELAADESRIPPEVMAQLRLARQYIGWFQSGYFVLMALIVVLAAGIALINLNVKKTTRALGSVLLIYGALEFAGVFFAGNYLPLAVPIDLPVSLRSWLNGLYTDLLAPLQIFSLGCLVAGIALLVVSFVSKPSAPAD